MIKYEIRTNGSELFSTDTSHVSKVMEWVERFEWNAFLPACLELLPSVEESNTKKRGRENDRKKRRERVREKDREQERVFVEREGGERKETREREKRGEIETHNEKSQRNR